MKKHLSYAALVGTIIPLSSVVTWGQAAPRAGFPDVQANQLWINSIPSGLPCYVTQHSSSPPAVFAEGNLKGKTPVLVSLDPGSYEIGFIGKGSGDLGAEFGPRFNGHIGHSHGSLTGSPYAVFTDVMKGTSAGSFIGLAFSSGLSAGEVSKLYPTETSFVFDESNVSAMLSSRGLKKEEISTGLELLRRGGKVLFSHKTAIKVPTTVEVKIDGSVEVVPKSIRR